MRETLQGVWRKIVKREYFTKRGIRYPLLRLECGHYRCPKPSREPKGDRVRCRECAGEIPF